MQRVKSRKRIAVPVALALAIAGSITAYAYFAASGTGTGTASVGSATNIALSGTVTGTLYPAGSPASVSVLVTNNGAASQYVNAVHLASIAVDHSSVTYTSASSGQQSTWDSCDVSTSGVSPAFTMADISVTTTLTKSGTGTDHVTKSGSLLMNDTGVSQNNCQGAPLQLNFTSN
jgi:hypothetical protein